VKSGITQGSALDLWLYNLFINGVCDFVHNSKCLLISDDLKKYLNTIIFMAVKICSIFMLCKIGVLKMTLLLLMLVKLRLYPLLAKYQY
jgi:hypothetical protein